VEVDGLVLLTEVEARPVPLLERKKAVAGRGERS
jgi:hypothetical protein